MFIIMEFDYSFIYYTSPYAMIGKADEICYPSNYLSESGALAVVQLIN